MSTTPANQPTPQRSPGLICGMLELCLRLLGLLFASLIFSIVLEFAGMLWFWPEQGWHHSHAMWLSELGWLSNHFKNSLLVQEPAQATAKVLERLKAGSSHRTGNSYCLSKFQMWRSLHYANVKKFPSVSVVRKI